MPGLRRLTALLRRLPRAPLVPSPSRPFASAAAAAQLQYDSGEEGWDRNPQEMVDTCGDAEGRSVQWVFMGSPGAQKHVYASRISRLLDVPCISMGSLVRQELSPRSSVYKQIANAVNEGKLVPEDIIFALLSKRLEEGYYRGETGFILDGIPRTRVQAVILDQIADIDLVVNFKSIDCLGKDHYGSGICSYCGKPCKSSASESTNLNPNLATRTQHNQLKSSIRDSKGTCVEKLCIHNEQNQLLKDYYRKQMKLLDFQVAGGPRETWQGLLAALHLQHIDAVSSSSSKKLTT